MSKNKKRLFWTLVSLVILVGTTVVIIKNISKNIDETFDGFDLGI